MVFEQFIRDASLAVGLKPSARQGEGRRRGLERMMYSKTISPRLRDAKPAGAGESGVFLQRPSALGQARRSPLARARAEYVFKDHQPSATGCEARRRGRERMMSSKTISPRPGKAKAAGAA